jgi:ubiquitin-like protein ATG12
LNEKKQEEPTPPTADQPISIPIPMQEMKMQMQQRVQPNKEKYKILFVAVGSAPMLKKNKFMLPGKEEFHTLQARLKRMLKLPTSSNLYLYINQSFIPSPEDLIGDLGDLFCVGEELQIHYSLQEAFL